MKAAIQKRKKSKPTKSKFVSHSHTLAGYAISRPAFETLAASLKPSTILPLLNQKGCLDTSREVFMAAMWDIGYEIPEPIMLHVPSVQWREEDKNDFFATVQDVFFPLHRLKPHERIEEGEQDKKILAHFADRIAAAGGKFDPCSARFIMKPFNSLGIPVFD
ncbi:hypothetical protein B0H13DRAFT_1949457 [Mycena leptocephala]|nr:hypothetical protein B0H13DRAFT_1949457 [Mycena leptocephala]